MNTLTNLSPFSVTMTALAFLLAFAINAYNSGKIFNWVTTPVAALPFLGVGIPFVGAVYKSLSDAGSLSGVAIVNAIFSGLFALLGSGGGAVTHNALSQHFELPKKTLAARAAKAAAKVTSLVGLILMLCQCNGSTPPLPPNTPPDVNAEIECVATDLIAKHVADVGQIAKDCTNNELALAADLVTWLLEFDKVRAKLSTEAIAATLTSAQAMHTTAAQTKKAGESR